MAAKLKYRVQLNHPGWAKGGVPPAWCSIGPTFKTEAEAEAHRQALLKERAHCGAPFYQPDQLRLISGTTKAELIRWK